MKLFSTVLVLAATIVSALPTQSSLESLLSGGGLVPRSFRNKCDLTRAKLPESGSPGKTFCYSQNILLRCRFLTSAYRLLPVQPCCPQSRPSRSRNAKLHLRDERRCFSSCTQGRICSPSGRHLPCSLDPNLLGLSSRWPSHLLHEICRESIRHQHVRWQALLPPPENPHL